MAGEIFCDYKGWQQYRSGPGQTTIGQRIEVSCFWPATAFENDRGDHDWQIGDVHDGETITFVYIRVKTFLYGCGLGDEGIYELARITMDIPFDEKHCGKRKT